MAMNKGLVISVAAILTGLRGCSQNTPPRLDSPEAGAKGSETADKVLRKGMTSREAFAALRVEGASPPFGTLRHAAHSVVSKRYPEQVVDLEFDFAENKETLQGWRVRNRLSTDVFVPVCWSSDP
jgi:hypothetical protein